MSLNKFTNSDTIKPYLNIACNTLNCQNLLRNGLVVHTSFSYYEFADVTSSNGVVSQARAYISSNINVMTINVRCKITTTTDSSSIFINVKMPILSVADLSKDVVCIGTITGANNHSLISKECILADNITLRSQYCSSTTMTAGEAWLNAQYTLTYL